MVSKTDKALIKKTFTVESFLNNPTGDKGSNAMTRRLAYDSYTHKINELLKAGKKFPTKFFLCGGTLFIKVGVPSESLDLHYDVVLAFKTGNSIPTGKGILALPVTFFSNAPSFTYTYAYAFNMYGMIPEELIPKVAKEAISDYSKIRNPDLTSFYEKTITLAMIFLRSSGRFEATFVSSNLFKVPLKRFLDTIPSSEDKEIEYKKKNSLEVAKRKKERALKKAETEKNKVNNKKLKSETRGSMKVNNKIDNKVNMKVNMKVTKK